MARRSRKVKRSRSRKVRRVSRKRNSRRGGRKRRTKKRVSRKMKGGAIEKTDVLYQDDLVCILKPDVKKGIIVWTHYTQPNDSETLCTSGLKTGTQMYEEGIKFGRTRYHPYIFFRAPYYSQDINYESIESEAESSYGPGSLGNTSYPKVWIRVDPDKTFVFSSNIRQNLPLANFHIDDGRILSAEEQSRTHTRFIMKKTDERYNGLYHEYTNSEVEKSKKTLTEYLRIIKGNEYDESEYYNLYTSEKTFLPTLISEKDKSIYPIDDTPIERESEILVSIPHLTPNYFVLCTE
jgi:hypothetical protein